MTFNGVGTTSELEHVCLLHFTVTLTHAVSQVDYLLRGAETFVIHLHFTPESGILQFNLECESISFPLEHVRNTPAGDPLSVVDMIHAD